jgi:5-formyltetrahydrofolate cyclo-ligase
MEVGLSGRAKKELRSEMKKIASSLDRRWMKAASAEACQFLTRVVDQELGEHYEHLLAWTSFFPGEIDLSHFISQQLEKRFVYLPRVQPDGSMTFISIDKDWVTSVEEGFYGIPEPSDQSGKTYELSSAGETVVIVPGLAFDREGNRLGRGKGVYDRFLGRNQMHEAMNVGVCWELQLVNKVPADSHDVRMDWICHERGYFEIKGGEVR